MFTRSGRWVIGLYAVGVTLALVEIGAGPAVWVALITMCDIRIGR